MDECRGDNIVTAPTKTLSMGPEDVSLSESLAGLFPRRPTIVDAITQHMREHGFLRTCPLVLGTWPGQDTPVLVDGYTRLDAAIIAGASPVHCMTIEFTSERAAVEHAIHCQRNRRNLTDAELFACIEALDELKPRGGDRKSADVKSMAPDEAIDSGRSAKRTAELLGTSKTKVEKMRAVARDSEASAAVASGEKSLNAAYTEIRAKTATAKKNKQTETAPAKPPDLEPTQAPSAVCVVPTDQQQQDRPQEEEELETENEFVDFFCEEADGFLQYMTWHLSFSGPRKDRTVRWQQGPLARLIELTLIDPFFPDAVRKACERDVNIKSDLLTFITIIDRLVAIRDALLACGAVSWEELPEGRELTERELAGPKLQAPKAAATSFTPNMLTPGADGPDDCANA